MAETLETAGIYVGSDTIFSLHPLCVSWSMMKLAAQDKTS